MDTFDYCDPISSFELGESDQAYFGIEKIHFCSCGEDVVFIEDEDAVLAETLSRIKGYCLRCDGVLL